MHTLERSQIEQVLTGVTAGVTRESDDNLRISLFVRGVCSGLIAAEVKGSNARNLWWASLVVNRAW